MIFCDCLRLTNPRGELTQFGYNRNGQITSLTDPRSNTTSWAYDVQGRLTRENCLRVAWGE